VTLTSGRIGVSGDDEQPSAGVVGAALLATMELVIGGRPLDRGADRVSKLPLALRGEPVEVRTGAVPALVLGLAELVADGLQGGVHVAPWALSLY